MPGAGARLNPADYDRFQTLILGRTGMLFGPRRKGALAKGVLVMSAKWSQNNIEVYYRTLEKTPTDSRLWDDLIDELTIGETYFFRDGAQFDVLRQNVLPELIRRHQHDHSLRIWSAGCASGEEAYSIAMLLDELLPGASQWNLFILATDINREVLVKAETGQFREWSFRQTSPVLRHRFFKQEGDGFTLRSKIRRMVTVAYLNLSEASYPSLSTNTNAMDLILCRNVAIYQSESTVAAVINRFHRCLIPSGWLMVGAAETSIPVFGRFTTRNLSGTTVFQKVDESQEAERSAIIAFSGRDVSAKTWGPLAEISEPAPQTNAIGKAAPAKPRVEPSLTTDKQAAPETGNANKLYTRGMSLLQRKRFEAAMHVFEACLLMDPDFTPAFLQMAMVQANRGCLAEAKDWCLKALGCEPLSIEARYTLALICIEQGDDEAALSNLKKAIYLDADFILGHFSLAILYRRQRALEKYHRHRRQAIRLASRMPLESVLAGSDDLTSGQLLTMARVLK